MNISNIFEDINSSNLDKKDESFSKTYSHIGNFMDSFLEQKRFKEEKLSDTEVDKIVEDLYNTIKSYDLQEPFSEGDKIKIPEQLLPEVIFKSYFMEGYWTEEELNAEPEKYRDLAAYKAHDIIENNGTLTYKGRAYSGRVGNKEPYFYKDSEVFVLGVSFTNKYGIGSLSTLFITKEDLEKSEVTTKFQLKDFSEYEQEQKDAYAEWLERAKKEESLYTSDEEIDKWVEYFLNSISHFKNLVQEYLEKGKSKEDIAGVFSSLNKAVGDYKAANYIKLVGVPREPVHPLSYMDKYADLYMKGKAPDHFNKWMAKIEKERQL